MTCLPTITGDFDFVSDLPITPSISLAVLKPVTTLCKDSAGRLLRDFGLPSITPEDFNSSGLL